MAETIRLAESAQKNGYDGISIQELVGQSSEDAFVRIGAVSQKCKGLKLATNIVGISTRHPIVLAMSGITCARASDYNFILGLGSGSNISLKSMGIVDSTYSLTRVSEAIEIIHKLLNGERVEFKGRFFSASGIQLIGPRERNRIPVYLAAIQDKAVKFAISRADGIFMSFCSSENYVKHVAKLVRESDLNQTFKLACNLFYIPLSDKSEGLKIARKLISQYISIPKIGELLLRESGFNPTIAEQTRRGSIDGISQEIVETMVVVGSHDKLKERLRNLEKIGVSSVMLGTEPSLTRDLTEAFAS